MLFLLTFCDPLMLQNTMAKPKPKRRKTTVSRTPSSEPLLSTCRDDGLWESIEGDDNQVPATQSSTMPPGISGEFDNNQVIFRKSTRKHRNPPCQSMRSAGTQTSLEPLPTQTTTSPKKPNEESDGRDAPATKLAQATQSLPSMIPYSRLRDVGDAVVGAPMAADGLRRRRGRPKNLTGFRNHRRVRFSDPAPSEHEPEMPSRDSHVFVRLLRVIVEFDHFPAASAGRRRQEFSWNNRGKGWKAAGRRGDEGLVEVLSLFELSPRAGVGLHPIIVPTERRGVQQPVEMSWDGGRACFLGSNQDEETLSVTLGEMKDMARDPWARQFVGYVMN